VPPCNHLGSREEALLMTIHGGICTNCQDQEGGMHGTLCPFCGRCNDCTSNYPGKHAPNCKSSTPATKRSKNSVRIIKGRVRKGVVVAK